MKYTKVYSRFTIPLTLVRELELSIFGCIPVGLCYGLSTDFYNFYNI